jgi:hypothetical protein
MSPCMLLVQETKTVSIFELARLKTFTGLGLKVTHPSILFFYSIGSGG